MPVELQLYYNPFEAKTTLENRGVPETLPCFGNGTIRLQEWLYAFFSNVKEKYRLGDGAECHISFYGTPGDFEDLELARDTFCKENKGIKVTLDHETKASKPLAKRWTDLRTLFDRMQNESPYEELQNSALRTRFDRVLDSEFEMSVIATMSSGKSTLVNALLGREILPARNEATTAKITRIKDNDGMKDFTVMGLRRFDDKLEPGTQKVKATLEEVDKLNSDPVLEVIELEGNIPGINSREMRFVLSDTPGPNNSRIAEHARHIENLIQDDTYKPMIMYLLNATQLEVEDDKRLLEKIAHAMEGSGKQSKDRFLFVLNKADELDPEKDGPVEKKIADCTAYLESTFKISDSRIFPASAMLAKLLRMKKAGQSMSGNEEDFLETKPKRFIGRKESHFSDFAALSPSCKKKQEEMLKDAIESNDENTQADIYSGVPAIELAMDEYLGKYAFTAKINEAVATFKGLLTKLDLKNKTEQDLAKDSQKREQVLAELEQLKTQLAKGEKTKDLVAQFDAELKKTQDRLANSFVGFKNDVSKLFLDEQKKHYTGDDVLREQAENTLNETARNIKENYNNLCGELTSLFDQEMRAQAKNFLEEYRQYISGLMQSGDFPPDAALDLIGLDMPDDPDVIINGYLDKKDFVYDRGEVKNKERKWFNPFTWSLPGKVPYFETITEDVVKLAELYENEIQPRSKQFSDAINKANEVTTSNAKGLKDFFTGELGKLTDVLEATINREQESLASQKSIEQKIEENKGKKAWLDQFIADLDRILSI